MWKNADIPRSDVPPPPANQTKWYKALLHQVSLTCGRMQMYPGQMYPPLIKPSGTEHYYTSWVWHVEECRHTQVRGTPTPANQTKWYKALLHQVSLTCQRMQMYPGQMYLPRYSNWVVQSTTTPGEFDMWKNADVPRSDVPPTNQTQWYRALLYQVSLTCGRMQTYPGQMYPSTYQTKWYIALLHQLSLTCGRMQTYPGQMYPHPLLIKPSGT